MNFVVKTIIKEYLRKEDHNVSSDLIDEMNRDITRKLEDAIGRCDKNGRKTISGRDY